MSIDEGTPPILPTRANPGIHMSLDEGTPPTNSIPETNMFCFSDSIPKKFTDEQVLEIAKSAFNNLYSAGGTLKRLYEWFLIDTWEGAVAYPGRKL